MKKIFVIIVISIICVTLLSNILMGKAKETKESYQTVGNSEISVAKNASEDDKKSETKKKRLEEYKERQQDIWLVPNIVSPHCFVSISEMSDYNPSDTNNSTFAIAQFTNVARGKPVSITTNGADDYQDHVGEWSSDVTDGSLKYQPVSAGIEDGCVAWVNDDYEQLMTVTVNIDLQGAYKVNKIRYNMGNCQFADSWNADIMESPFARTSTNPGTSYSGVWTEHTGEINTSSVVIKFEKTRTIWKEDWFFIGEIEIFGTPITNSIIPEISLNRHTLNYGGTISGIVGDSQDIVITNNGNGTLNWAVSENKSWLSCTPTSGSHSGIFSVSVDLAGLAVGVYSGIITVSDPNATNSPQTASVILKVYTPDQTIAPFGEFATPIDGLTVSSSIPVTGWVLDDIGVESVKIYRTEGNGKVFIGDAIFVEGARPDVEQTYPTYPNNYNAGWGYMLLTNFLPNNGNGTFTLHAIATDVEGLQVTLGTKTILVDNANAVKPFGAIDTPTQGGTVSGGNYRNVGWVLTPQPNMIPTNGHTIAIWVDGVNLGHPTYNIYRSDVAGFFPGYANSNGATGYFDFDTTSYINGVHSIFWTAADNAGNEDGIGSRYFLVQNTGNSRIASANREKTFDPEITDLIDIPISYDEPVELQKGYTYNYSTEDVYPDPTGNIYVQCKELERIEIQVTRAGMEVEGYLAVGTRLMNLPVGSTLEKMTGRFSWIPGPGFVGTYRLVFIETGQDGETSRKNILVTIAPKFTGE